MADENDKQGSAEGEVEIVVRNERPARRDMILPASIVFAALVIGGTIIFSTIYKSGASPANVQGATSIPAAASSASTTAILTLGPRDAVLGNASATVTIIEYGDYQCPYCAEYFENVQPSIVKDYIDTGEAKMVFRNFAFLGPESTAAAQAAECAEDQNQLWAYHDALYNAKLADYNKGGSEDDGVLNRTLFLNIAKQLDLNISEFTNCIDSNKYAALVTQEYNDGVTIGISGTPTTFINGAMAVDSTGGSAGADAASILSDIAKAVASSK